MADKSTLGTTIAPCTCQNTYQDAKYGRFMRVHNLKAKEATGKLRCTVCGRVK